MASSEINTSDTGKAMSQPASNPVRIVEYDPNWPRRFERESVMLSGALGARALSIEHAGSTSVPGLPAKPVIDIVLAVADSADEGNYAAALHQAGYHLRIREPDWYEHRMFNDEAHEVNLHVFSAGCPEIDQMLLFRDWLRNDSIDRDLYARTKRELARRGWKSMQDYANAKTAVVQEILARARTHFAQAG